MSKLDSIPFTTPDTAFRGRLSESDAQKEYIAAIEQGVKFAASGHEGQWLYSDVDNIAALYPNGDKVIMPCTDPLNWIKEAQRKL